VRRGREGDNENIGLYFVLRLGIVMFPWEVLIAFSKSTSGRLRGNRPYAVKPGVVGVLDSSQPASNSCEGMRRYALYPWLPYIANGRFHLDVVMSGQSGLMNVLECTRQGSAQGSC